MYATPGSVLDTVDFVTGFLLILFVETQGIHGQEGDGCGHTVLGTQSGTLASRNFPGTYPNGTQCVWRLQAAQGRTLRLVFGDFDLEYSPNCSAGSLTITPSNGAPSLGPLCGTMHMMEKKLVLNSSEATVRFISGIHRSGRGFVLSYATDQQPDLISCMERGTHLSTPQVSAFCPVGCRDVSGDIWGQAVQGYRDTSVLCKAAVHAGVISDSLGGPITVSREKSITLYESSSANGVLSKTGSLSEKRLVFSRECQDELHVFLFNASSYWEEVDSLGRHFVWSPANKGTRSIWAPKSDSADPWLELDLRDRSNITGIITKGSEDRNDFYVKSYTVHYSRDRKHWKVYKTVGSKEERVFEGNSDSIHETQNSLIPSVAARYLLLRPRDWHRRAALQVRVLGCPALRTRSFAYSPPGVTSTAMSPQEVTTSKGPLIKKTPDSESSRPVIVVVGAAVALAVCVGLLLAGICWKRRKNAAEVKCSLVKGCQGSAGKTQDCFHGNLPRSESELIAYPLERGDTNKDLAKAVLTDYAEPDLIAAGQKLGSTFRPAADEGYTIPLILNHYDVPGKIHEYAEPLPPEPEYATPFSEQSADLFAAGPKKNICVIRVVPPAQAPRPFVSQEPSNDSPMEPQYDRPAQQGHSGYCTPQTSANGPRKASVVYAEPQPACHVPSDSHGHMYHEPL
nr:PREDICTED: discoidin, CUB and LCCL domain-containing protein 1-like [Lepisosteus oculatus]